MKIFSALLWVGLFLPVSQSFAANSQDSSGKIEFKLYCDAKKMDKFIVMGSNDTIRWSGSNYYTGWMEVVLKATNADGTVFDSRLEKFQNTGTNPICGTVTGLWTNHTYSVKVRPYLGFPEYIHDDWSEYSDPVDIGGSRPCYPEMAWGWEKYYFEAIAIPNQLRIIRSQ